MRYARGRGVVHASGRYRFRHTREFINRSSVGRTMHGFEDLQQAPPLTLITLRVENSFAFKVYIIDKGVAPLWSSCQALELLLYVGSIGRRRFGEHFRQCSLQPGNKEFSLKIDRIDEKLA